VCVPKSAHQEAPGQPLIANFAKIGDTEAVSDTSRFAVALSLNPEPVAAATDAARRIKDQLAGAPVTLAVVFASPSLCTDPWALLDALHAELAPEHLIGCVGETIIGDGREVEGAPALSLWCAVLPDVGVETFRLSVEHVDGDDEIVGWPEPLGDAGPDATPMLVLIDPFTLAADVMLDQHNARSRQPLIGGLASGGRRAGEHVMFHDRDVHFDGGVGVQLPGAHVIPVVSQGCAPIGPDMVITAGGGPVVAELAGTNAFDKITHVVDALSHDERHLLRQPLLAGIVINENQPEYGRGDFLVRGIHGRDPDTGAVYIGEHVRVGQTFRLHVRDAHSADEDLRMALRETQVQSGVQSLAAALIFSCNGRGTHMFGTPDHDATAISDELGVPTAGLFCNGEIGPVGGKTFLHGFTATMAVFLHE
jgi:small ligand-binding sensory domain FIST